MLLSLVDILFMYFFHLFLSNFTADTDKCIHWQMPQGGYVLYHMRIIRVHMQIWIYRR